MRGDFGKVIDDERQRRIARELDVIGQDGGGVSSRREAADGVGSLLRGVLSKSEGVLNAGRTDVHQDFLVLRAALHNGFDESATGLEREAHALACGASDIDA